MVDDAIIDAVQNYLQACQEKGLPVSFGVLFGSYATGRAHELSDIDLVVVSPRFDGPRRLQDVNLLWRLTAFTDYRIEPIPCGEIQWREDDASAILEMARREGVRIDLPQAAREKAA